MVSWSHFVSWVGKEQVLPPAYGDGAIFRARGYSVRLHSTLQLPAQETTKTIDASGTSGAGADLPRIRNPWQV